MSNWSPGEWAAFLLAFGTFINTMLIAVAAFLANLARIKGEENAAKIDDNTVVTKTGVAEAVVNAKIAADTAEDAKIAAEKLSRQFNGDLDARITKIVEEHLNPLTQLVRELACSTTLLKR